MNRALSLLACVVVLCILGLFLSAVHEACACPAADSVLWRTTPAADTATAAGHFDTSASPGTTVSLQLDWSFRETPYIGAGEVASSGNVNINTGSVTYDPAYFYPQTCEGSVGIHVSGDLTNSGQNGTLKSKGWVWDSGSPPPYDEDTHTLTIYHS